MSKSVGSKIGRVVLALRSGLVRGGEGRAGKVRVPRRGSCM